MSKRSICPQNRSKTCQIERECSRREKQREESSSVNKSKFRFVLAGVCSVSDSKSFDYFVITLKLDQLQA